MYSNFQLHPVRYESSLLHPKGIPVADGKTDRKPIISQRRYRGTGRVTETVGLSVHQSSSTSNFSFSLSPAVSGKLLGSVVFDSCPPTALPLPPTFLVPFDFATPPSLCELMKKTIDMRGRSDV
mmetsp:Transcript_7858/g.15319  ORF Transcript_7858/g.15319 Transcript_7858/m.15319 type:complete len:124 (-) Transcript_7858:866-1237(-)